MPLDLITLGYLNNQLFLLLLLLTENLQDETMWKCREICGLMVSVLILLTSPDLAIS